LCCVADEVIRQLGYCVRDGLVRHVKRIGYKGAKTGVEQESYRLPKPKVLVSSQRCVSLQKVDGNITSPPHTVPL